MDADSVMRRTKGWLDQRYAERQTIPRDQLASEAERSDLPREAKDAIELLPEGEYAEDVALDAVRDTVMAIVTGGGRLGETR